VLFVGFGAPKAELFLHRHMSELGSGVALSVGAALDFCAGNAVRAPQRWQGLGLEWLWRAVHEPRRLARRYALSAPAFLVAVAPTLLRHWTRGLRRSSTEPNTSRTREPNP
jgi:N-acetylglucosaminyldiphosphoundecaprenol N-acetyl-beta-D-mannosaminyltransferase